MTADKALIKSSPCTSVWQRLWAFRGSREALIVLGLALVTRCVGLGSFMTIDEPTWMTRSKEFTQAILSMKPLGTLRTPHPGVTVMWLGAASMGTEILWAYVREDSPRPPFSQFAERFKPPDVATLAQGIMAISCSVGLSLIVLLLSQLTDPLTGLCAGVFMALEPWLTGHSRVFHLDMLMATLMVLSFLLLLMDVGRPSNLWVLLSGVVAAAAFLTKTPAAVVAVAVPLVAMHRVLSLYGLRGMRSWRPVRDWVCFGLLWATSFLLTTLLIWPALLFHPLVTARRLYSGAVLGLETTPMEVGISGQPLGPGYILSGLSCQISPFSLFLGIVGLGLLAGFLLKRRHAAWPVAALVALSALYVGLMVQGVMLTTRYLLVAAIAVDVLAALVPAAILTRIPSRTWRICAWLGIFLPSVLLAAYWVPYGTLYVTPFLMGRPIDRDVNCRGWGEGMREAADYLNQKPNAEDLKVASWYDGVLGLYLKGSCVELDRCFTENPDYVVMYANQIQRRRSPQVVDVYWPQTPEKVIGLKGRDLVWIYRARKP